MNHSLGLSYNTRKALTVHLGESAASELAALLQRMASQIEELKRSKVNVTPVVPAQRREDFATLENETF